MKTKDPVQIAKHQILRRAVYVWELPVRLFHWINALAITTLFITGMYIANSILSAPGEPVYYFVMGKMRAVHGVIAFIFIGNLLFRGYWFWAGNSYAKIRFWKKEFWRDVWVSSLYYLLLTREHVTHKGHNSLALLVYLLVMWLVGPLMIITGLAMRGGGNPEGIWQSLFWWVVPWSGGEYQVRYLHHSLAWVFAIFVTLHLYLVIRQDILDDDGTVSSMFNGYKYELAEEMVEFEQLLRLENREGEKDA